MLRIALASSTAPTSRLHAVCALVLGATLSACGAAAPLPSPRPEQPAPTAEVRDPLAEPWMIRRAVGSVTHEIRLDAVLTSRIDSIEQSDTLRAIVAASWSKVAGAGGARLSGLLTSSRIAGADTALATTPAGLNLPIPFAAQLGARGDQPRFTSPRADDCSAAAAAVQSLREVMLSPPERLTKELSWADSARYVVCRDSLLLSVNSVRQYRVLGAVLRGGEVVVRVERRSTSTMSGDGTQFGEPLTIAAEGSGTAVLALRLDGGVPVAGEGDAELRMTMRGRRRTQELRQRTHITIVTP